jgi:ribosomal protein S18 acetylase RimI-like enzyme
VGLEVQPATSSSVKAALPRTPRSWDQTAERPRSSWTVKPLSTGDWGLLRAARVRSLATSAAELAGDLDAVRGYDEERWRGEIARREWFIATGGDRPVGVAALNRSAIANSRECLALDQPHAHIEALWVDPDLRHRGIARALVGAAIRKVAEMPVVGLWVFEKNDDASIAFKAMGFEHSPFGPQDYRGDSDEERRRPPRQEYHMHRFSQ